jgi:hypothetical protein
LAYLPLAQMLSDHINKTEEKNVVAIQEKEKVAFLDFKVIKLFCSEK